MLDAVYAFLPVYIKGENATTIKDEETGEERTEIEWTDQGEISDGNTTLILSIFSVA